MARRRSDVFKVVVFAADAHALLRRGCSDVRALFETEEDVLELHHAGIGKQQRRVAGDQGRGRDFAVRVALEIIEECAADLRARHTLGHKQVASSRQKQDDPDSAADCNGGWSLLSINLGFG